MKTTMQTDPAGIRVGELNIWAMDKDQDIKHLLLLLTEQLGEDGFAIDERILTDLRAVYICDLDEPEMRAYLYTLGQAPGRYGVHLEYPESSEANPVYDVFENLSLPSLVSILAVHLDVNEIQPLPVLH
ncbi:MULTISPECIES: hypothetical protein [unclassified Oceanobacter]|jgi:hypothetical protein|uniref:hypothetical protein n=1 Tax=unclassified Oceanobacter TaxID=2620260 RepID=UPI0026E3D6A1|nr:MULTISPECIES: hypothetical protein [unclassified Oceanobacter]MDO6804183.1 hypothetical protein [Wenyingzhuangia sp. 1_MG-2023]MDO6682090.1 hypothetical protein [Oceanobacter sp. 5_MG-2023]MDP2505515.1 hypothetical protein [Oceanobacter sp. 3_MG-2023]MDP2547090.1 hypothetical protein [Oceanobacter sp. 4_MG-2023]MDP2609715.1 hypothetical protein [Oceanobacter sp. 1_MG-2023]